MRPCRRCHMLAARSIRANARISGLSPPFHALREETVLPALLRGPVDLPHGRHRLIASACLARRSGVHPDLRIDFD